MTAAGISLRLAERISSLLLSQREEILPMVRIPADIPARCSCAGYAERKRVDRERVRAAPRRELGTG